MYLREVIKLEGKPFPSPFPVNSEIIVDMFAQNGFNFEKVERLLILNERYMPDRLQIVKKLTEENGWDLEITHSLSTVYEDHDFEKNPLWILLFPDIWIEGINFENVCKICKKSTVVVDFGKKVSNVKSKKPVLSVNGQFTIVREDLKKRMELELLGVRFEAFDDKGEYFHLLSKSSLGELINTPDDFIGYNGTCSECNLPVYKMFFGPLTYLKSNWSGDDIVSGGYHEGVFFTEKAYLLISSVEKKVSKYGVAILE